MKTLDELAAQAEAEILRRLGPIPPEFLKYFVTAYCDGYAAGCKDMLDSLRELEQRLSAVRA